MMILVTITIANYEYSNDSTNDHPTAPRLVRSPPPSPPAARGRAAFAPAARRAAAACGRRSRASGGGEDAAAWPENRGKRGENVKNVGKSIGKCGENGWNM